MTTETPPPGELTPTPSTPANENHRGSCHKAHPGVRHGEWERKRRGLPPYRGPRTCPGSTVFEIIDEREATAAGISARFQCQDCGAILGSERESHNRERAQS